jgi:cell division protein FtsI (penicillin-binding protein 3)
MTTHSLHRRSLLLQVLVFAVWGGLTVRLVYLQWTCREEYGSLAERQHVSEEVIPARPGDILDRQGHLLATTVSAPSLFVDPSRIEDPTEFSRLLAPLVNLDANQLSNRIAGSSQRRFLWVKRLLSDREAEQVRELALPNDVAGLRREFQRHYPQGPLAAHVLGLRDIDGLGRGGAEQAFDELLRGRDGVRRFVRDARGYVLEFLEEVTEPPRHGATVVLTLDLRMQLFVERRLDRLMTDASPQGACAVVLDPRTGEVLAMASRPTFDPNHPQNVPAEAWKNLAISAVYEPGSTFKPMVVAWALQQGLLEREETFHCEHGSYRMGRRVLHDHHPYGELSLTDVLVKSSNIGMAKIGELLGNEQLYQLARLFGFGQRTGIELPGELSGLLRPLADWNSYSTGSIPMGQELAATPMQVLAAHAVLAAGGRRVSPHLLLMVSDGDGAEGQRGRGDEGTRGGLVDGVATLGSMPRNVVVSEVIEREVAEWLVQGPMREVVRRGTGTRAEIEGENVFGKTGTAQKVSPEGGYSSTRHVASFVCGAPANAPRLLVIVTVDEPSGEQYGGTVAAPVAAEILEKCLYISRR